MFILVCEYRTQTPFVATYTERAHAQVIADAASQATRVTIYELLEGAAGLCMEVWTRKGQSYEKPGMVG